MNQRKRVMAIASGGGHWVQLRRIMPALDGMDVFYVSLDPSLAADVPGHDYYTIRDVSRRDRFGILIVVWQLLKILFKERPKVVITTGSLPALIGLILAKYLFGAKTIWIDSIANAEKLSASGKKAGKVADLWLTQWPHLSGPDGPKHWGAVL
jgi:UDP-N-acetylglucosamine:LPS N-acetylglucosamine transferase